MAIIYHLAEDAVTVEFPGGITEATMRLVRSFDCYVNKNPFSGFIETVPAFVTVTLFYDVLITEAAGVDVLHFVQSALNDYGLDSDACVLQCRIWPRP